MHIKSQFFFVYNVPLHKLSILSCIKDLLFLDYTLIEGDIIYYDSDLDADEEEYEDSIDEYFLWDLDESSGTVPIPYSIDSRSSAELRRKIMTAILDCCQYFHLS